jgi:hypothetical protein
VGESRQREHAARAHADGAVDGLSPRRLELEVPRRLDKQVRVVAATEVERLERGQLAEATRIALDRIVAQPTKCGDQVSFESVQRVLADDLRGAGSTRPGPCCSASRNFALASGDAGTAVAVASAASCDSIGARLPEPRVGTGRLEPERRVAIMRW